MDVVVWNRHETSGKPLCGQASDRTLYCTAVNAIIPGGAHMTNVELLELVLSLEQQVWKAVVKKDGTALGELLADDYIEITADGRRTEKAVIVDQSPQVDEIEGYVIDCERVVSLGENSAAFSYHLTLDGRCRGTTITPRERWATSIWSRIDGRWLCCLFQQSPISSKGH